MKKTILYLVVFVFAAITASAQVSTSNQSDANKKAAEQKRMDEQKRLEQEAIKQTNNPNAPVITFENTVHDYGTIPQHADGNCEFKFTNDGKEPLILSNVRSSCGCTVPTWPRQPIMPGQSDVIKVKYDTKRIGIINKSIHVYSNATVPTVSLKITGKIEAPDNTKAPEKEVEKTGTPVNK